MMIVVFFPIIIIANNKHYDNSYTQGDDNLNFTIHWFYDWCMYFFYVNFLHVFFKTVIEEEFLEESGGCDRGKKKTDQLGHCIFGLIGQWDNGSLIWFDEMKCKKTWWRNAFRFFVRQFIAYVVTKTFGSTFVIFVVVVDCILPTTTTTTTTTIDHSFIFFKWNVRWGCCSVQKPN